MDLLVAWFLGWGLIAAGCLLLIHVFFRFFDGGTDFLEVDE